MKILTEIVYKLNALNQFYKSSHWLSRSDCFFTRHLLYAELYVKIDKEIDDLVELSLSYYDLDKEFNSKFITDEVVKISIDTDKEFIKNVELAINQESDLLEAIDKIKESDCGKAIYNLVCDIAQNHARNNYLLSRILI